MRKAAPTASSKVIILESWGAARRLDFIAVMKSAYLHPNACYPMRTELKDRRAAPRRRHELSRDSQPWGWLA